MQSSQWFNRSIDTNGRKDANATDRQGYYTNKCITVHTSMGGGLVKRWCIGLHQCSCATLSPVNGGMGDSFRAGKLNHYETSQPGQLSFPSFGVGKWVPAIAGKVKAGMAYSGCGWMCGCAGKTVRSLENTCHTWALLRWGHNEVQYQVHVPLPSQVWFTTFTQTA